MFSIGNEELGELEPVSKYLDENGHFKVVHTHEDGTEEIATVSCGVGSNGPTWTAGGYTLKNGRTFLAVVGGRILEDIKVLTNDSNIA